MQRSAHNSMHRDLTCSPGRIFLAGLTAGEVSRTTAL